MRARLEPFGAWVRAGDDLLVAVDRNAARRLGLDGEGLWSESPCGMARPPLEVHVAVTERCGAGCTGCYTGAHDEGSSPDGALLDERLAAVAAAGAFTVAFGGGEPLVRPDLGWLATRARAHGLVPVVTTSGIGMTAERARELGAFAQVNVSYDGEGDDYARVRGWSGAGVAERAMALLADAGVPFGVNVVLVRDTFDKLASLVARADSLGAREVQLLRYKPAGRARDLGYLARRLSPRQVDALGPLVERLLAERDARGGTVALRIDCALVPLLSTHGFDAAALARFGVFGCEAGRHLTALRVDGRLAPCSFGPSADALVPGAWDAPAPAWHDDPVLAQWRSPHATEPCASCPIRSVCRGGCRVVAEHLTGVAGPDPECPRVRAARAVDETSGDGSARG